MFVGRQHNAESSQALPAQEVDPSHSPERNTWKFRENLRSAFPFSYFDFSFCARGVSDNSPFEILFPKQ